jgi:hypothetical protein
MNNDISELVADRSLTGNLIDIQKKQPGAYDIPELRLIGCPFSDCKYEIDDWDKSRKSISDHLLHEHQPEDFGLTPLRERSDPEQVVISECDTSYVYHTTACRAVRESEAITRVDFEDIESEYRHCKRCKGKSSEEIQL